MSCDRSIAFEIIAAVILPTALSACWLHAPICRVAIDVGHSETRPGALSSRGISEYHYNREVSEILLKELASRLGVEAMIIDPGGADAPLAARSQVAARAGAGVLVSIHHDSVQPHYLSTWTYAGREQRYCDRFRGYSLFYSERNQRSSESLSLALELGNALRAAGFSPTLHHAEEIPGENRELMDGNLGVYRYDDLNVLHSAPMPAVLIECGVIVHREEEALLRNPSYRLRMVQALAEGIQSFCRTR